MHASTLDVLRCPYCGGRLELVKSLFHQQDGDELHDGILGCHCCIFPVITGIPVMHLSDTATIARAHVEAGRPDLARNAMFNLGDAESAARFQEVAASGAATYRDVVDALGPSFEGRYFLYRFSDPTFLVADAVARAVAATALAGGGRAIDICGGAGHLTRSLVGLSKAPPLLADLYFSKVWLARRFTAPACEGICCDGNAPLPFARGAFRFAMCTDAFMYIWTKRQLVAEMARLLDDGDDNGAIVIGHTHNASVWSPSHGQPLTPDGYRDLFETIPPRIFAEGRLFTDVVRGGPLELGLSDATETLDADPALTIVASRNPAVFRPHPLSASTALTGEYRLNPLYAADFSAGKAVLRLQFPSGEYEDEYGACRQYLPDEVVLDRHTFSELAQGRLPAGHGDLVRRRIVLDLPLRYY